MSIEFWERQRILGDAVCGQDALHSISWTASIAMLTKSDCFI